jgi:hypothetical protein
MALKNRIEQVRKEKVDRLLVQFAHFERLYQNADFSELTYESIANYHAVKEMYIRELAKLGFNYQEGN